MRRNVLVILLLVSLLTSGCASAGLPPLVLVGPPGEPVPASVSLDEPLPASAEYRIGELDNGLTYLIRRNTEPANRAELRLVVNAGSLLEEQDQRGLAHFLEHMMFNGTRDFAHNELVSYLERIGMQFGPDANAYTSYDETVYMLHVPTDKPDEFATAFKVLENWAAYATLDPAEIDAERGVIVEEQRMSEQNAGGRLRNKLIDTLLGGTRYAERLPIGDLAIVRTAPRVALERFYRTWYRPDLMAVVAVGDFDVDRVQALIEEHFAGLPAPENPQPRPTFDVETKARAHYAVITDPENPASSVEIAYKQPVRNVRTVGDLRDQLAGDLFSAMLNNRLIEITRRADAPFLGAGAGSGSLVRPLDIYTLSASAPDEKILVALDALVTEIERVRQHGFTQAELDRVKTDELATWESIYRDRASVPSAVYAGTMAAHFLEGSEMAGIEVKYPLVRALLPGITLEDVQAQVEPLLGEDDRAILAITPEKDGYAPPTEAQLAETVGQALAREAAPYEDIEASGTLMSEKPQPATIVSEETVPELGVTVVTLANGIRAVMKPTDFRQDEIIFSATSWGGDSLVSDEDYPEASALTTIMDFSGVADFDANTLDRMLAGKLAGAGPYLGTTSEGFYGQAAPKDLETALQLVYLYATQPRFDQQALENTRQQYLAALANREVTPDAVIQDTYEKMLYGKDLLRIGPLPTEAIQALDLDRARAVYADRFGDMSDFTFVFVGSFEVEALKPLLQTYIGTLPGHGRQETWRNLFPDPPPGVITATVRAGKEDQSIVMLEFVGATQWSEERAMATAELQSVLETMIRDDLRERLGGVYAPSVSAILSELPEPQYDVTIDFSLAPGRVDELIAATWKQIECLQDEGPSTNDVEKARQQALSDYEEAQKDNYFWLGNLDYYYTMPDRDPSEILNIKERIEAVTAADLQRLAQEFMPADRYLELVLYPEKYDSPALAPGQAITATVTPATR